MNTNICQLRTKFVMPTASEGCSLFIYTWNQIIFPSCLITGYYFRQFTLRFNHKFISINLLHLATALVWMSIVLKPLVANGRGTNEIWRFRSFDTNTTGTFIICESPDRYLDMISDFGLSKTIQVRDSDDRISSLEYGQLIRITGLEQNAPAIVERYVPRRGEELPDYREFVRLSQITLHGKDFPTIVLRRYLHETEYLLWGSMGANSKWQTDGILTSKVRQFVEGDAVEADTRLEVMAGVDNIFHKVIRGIDSYHEPLEGEVVNVREIPPSAGARYYLGKFDLSISSGGLHQKSNDYVSLVVDLKQIGSTETNSFLAWDYNLLKKVSSLNIGDRVSFKVCVQGGTNRLSGLTVSDRIVNAQEGDSVANIEKIKKDAAKGDANAQFILGTFYENGLIGTKDYQKALSLFQTAADKGLGKALCHLGVIFYEARGVKRNYGKAFNYFHAAAGQGNLAGQYNLGVLYAHGEGVVSNKVEAIKWYQESANRGCISAQCNLGLCYLEEIGDRRKYVQGIRLLNKAAEHGDTYAIYNLGLMSMNRFTRDHDYSEGVILLRRAAKQGFAGAECALGIAYAGGFGVDKDLTRSALLFREAAIQGFAEAQYSLGVAYLNGFGVARDRRDAYVWLSLAVINGYQGAELDRDLIKSRLSGSDLTDCHRRISSFIPVKCFDYSHRVLE